MLALSGMPFTRIRELRAVVASYRVTLLIFLLMLVAVAAALLAVDTARKAVLQDRAALPHVLPRVAWLQPSYLDRRAIDERLIDPPGFVRSLLWPALGSPALLNPGAVLDIVLNRPYPGAQLAVLPREALSDLDRELYALPPMPGGADLLAARLAAAQTAGGKGALEINLLPDERKALAHALADSKYQDARTALLARVRNDSDRDARDAAKRFHSGVTRIVERSAHKLQRLSLLTDCTPLGVGSSCVLRVGVPMEVQPGLFALLLLGADGKLLDFQMNAVYRPAQSSAGSFLVSADMQWGDAPNVAGAALSFVSLMNAAHAAGRAPEFIVMAGDVVDGQFGSAGRLWSVLFGSADNYTRDFLQAWLVLAALRVPIYLVPGNHDGYRFEDSLGEFRSDGLLLFQSTFGPLYHTVDRAPWRFVLLNSYDLPANHRTVRRGEGSNVVERFSERLNILNWGGGIGFAQFRWLRYQLGLDDGPAPKLSVALVMHHDPRGGYVALRRDFQQRQHQWSTERHVPIHTELSESMMSPLQRTPRSADTEEIHLGHYTPLRDGRSLVRGADWFDLGIRASLPDSLGWPGWSKYQQGWHSPAVYGRGFSDLRPDAADELVPPARLLRTLIDGRVRVIFKGHDNRFGRARMNAGESIFTSAAEEALNRITPAEQRKELSELRLLDTLDVYHVADLSDFNSDGHGFSWMNSEKDALTVLEIDHW
jgi:hypothetical protein